MSFKAEFESGIGKPYSREVLGYKAASLTNEDLENLVKLKKTGLAMNIGSRAATGAGVVLNGVENGKDIYDTCQKYGSDSRLCHKTEVGDTANFVVGQFASEMAGRAIARWAICNAALDIETAGTGLLICTAAVGLGSIAASSAAGSVAKASSEAGYDYLTESLSSTLQKNTGIIYTQHINIGDN